MLVLCCDVCNKELGDDFKRLVFSRSYNISFFGRLLSRDVKYLEDVLCGDCYSKFLELYYDFLDSNKNLICKEKK